MRSSSPTTRPPPRRTGWPSPTRLEDAARRAREVRWGPRTLDVDLVDVDGTISSDPVLTLPHPRAAERAFVLAAVV